VLVKLAKQLAKYLFDSEDSLIRLDMSEYMEKISLTRIQGASAGYIGYEDTNVLDKIRRNLIQLFYLMKSKSTS
jgi:ATP-dependent Clp protease ATP-binding subunit ClpC